MIAVSADVSNPQDVETLIGNAVERFGLIDIMVNNAGIEEKHPFLEMPFDVFQRVLAVNLSGAWLCSQAAAKRMVRQKRGGRIINISSVHDVDTPMDRSLKEHPEEYEKLLGDIPLHRMAKPEEIAAMCVYLASLWKGDMKAMLRANRDAFMNLWAESS